MHIFDSTIVQYYFLYGLYILLPLIPTILIYKLFPDTKLALKGPLQALTLNATGAFAGYIVCCMLGYQIIGQTIKALDDQQQGNYAWQVIADLNLMKPDSTTLSTQEANKCLEGFIPTISPPVIRTADKSIILFMPEALIKQHATINFSMSGFVPLVIKKSDLDKAPKNGVEKTIDLGVITLRQFLNPGAKPYSLKDTLKPQTSLPQQ